MSQEYTDGDGINALKINYEYTTTTSPWWTQHNWVYDAPLGTYNGMDITLGGGSDASEFYITKYNGSVYAARISGNSAKLEGYVKRSDGIKGWYFGDAGSSARVTQSWTSIITNYVEQFTEIPISTKLPTGIPDLHPSGQKIIVKWNRPSDQKELADMFSITVSNSDTEQE